MDREIGGDFVIGDRLPASDNLDRVGVIRPRGLSDPVPAQSRSIHAVDDRRTSERRQDDRYRILRKAVDRRHGGWSKSISGEAIDESPQSRDAHGLGAIPNEPQRAQIQSFQLRVVDLVEAQFERKIGRRGKGAVKAMDRPQPALRARKKAQR